MVDALALNDSLPPSVDQVYQANHECHSCISKGSNGTHNDVGAKQNISESVILSQPQLFLWSSSDEAGIARLATQWRRYFEAHSLGNERNEVAQQFIAHNLASRRTHLNWRAFAVGENGHSLLTTLENMSAPIRTAVRPNIGFIFTGVCVDPSLFCYLNSGSAT